MAVNLFIGYAPFRGLYYVNRRGENAIDRNAVQFRDVSSLLDHLTKEYNERRSSLTGISTDIPSEIKEEIFKHIKNKVRRLEILVN